MLTIHELETLVKNFFHENNCQVVEQEDNAFQVHLTEIMDRKLMNRPFYWHYLDTMNMQGTPAKITFVTTQNQKHKNGHLLHVSSPYFQRIRKQLNIDGKYTCLYEQTNTQKNEPLYPWLIINVKIIYKGVLLKEELFSLGINLFNTTIKNEMMENIVTKKMNKKISDYSYTLTPTIQIQSAYYRMINVLKHYIQNKEHAWAKEAIEQFNHEKRLMDEYFQEKNEHYYKVLQETKMRYQPTVKIHVINGGLFYLRESK